MKLYHKAEEFPVDADSISNFTKGERLETSDIHTCLIVEVEGNFLMVRELYFWEKIIHYIDINFYS